MQVLVLAFRERHGIKRVRPGIELVQHEAERIQVSGANRASDRVDRPQDEQ